MPTLRRMDSLVVVAVRRHGLGPPTSVGSWPPLCPHQKRLRCAAAHELSSSARGGGAWGPGCWDPSVNRGPASLKEPGPRDGSRCPLVDATEDAASPECRDLSAGAGVWVPVPCPRSHFVINGKQSQTPLPFLSKHPNLSDLATEGTCPVTSSISPTAEEAWAG